MPTKSPYAPLEISEQNIVHYLFRREREAPISDRPIWIEASDTSIYLTQKDLLQWATRLAVGLDNVRDREGGQVVQPGDVVLTFSPNHVMIPVAYLGAVGSGRIFSGVNAAYSTRGTSARLSVSFSYLEQELVRGLVKVLTRCTELVHQLRDAEPKIILVHPSLVDTAVAAAEQVGIPVDRIFQFSSQEADTHKGVRDWKFLLASSEECSSYVWPDMSGEKSKTTVAAINYSSGTTGERMRRPLSSATH